MYPTSINLDYLEEVVEILSRGGVIVYPTDSLYAIGCDALHNRAVERVCRLKGINPAKQRLSICCASISQASEYAQISNTSFRLMKDNLPGPFTFILPGTPRLSKAFKGRREVGVRVPDNAIATAIAEALGHPLLTASAEWDDSAPAEASRPEAVELRYGKDVDALVDGGDTPDIPSAIVSLVGPDAPEVLRQGPVPLSES